MRLAFIKKRFALYGGAERYLKTLIEYLKKSEYEIHIFANKWSEEENVIFHKIDVLPLSSFLSTVTFNQNVRRALKRSIAPDCIISFERTTCQDIYRAGDGCHVEWLRLRRFIEPRWRQFSFRINPLHIALLSLEKRLFQKTKLIIANSNMVKKQIIRNYGFPEKRIYVIYNGVDLQRFSPQNRQIYKGEIRKGLSIPEDAKVILFVGSDFERKGLSTLLSALTRLKMTNNPPLKDISLLVVGRGNINKFKSDAREYGIQESVVFLGPLSGIEKFYAAADVFVLPTIYDPFSNATLEAMASGLPVITTANNGASEVLEEGVDGFILHEVLDYNGLAEKIELVFSDSIKMGENARRKAERYPIEKAAEEFIMVLNSFKDEFNDKLS